MFTHTFIHVLEFAVCALFVLLFVQIWRGYSEHALQADKLEAERAATAAALISARARESVLGQRSFNSSKNKPASERPKLVKERVIMLDPVLVPASTAASVLKPKSTQAFAKLNAANGVSGAPIKASEILLNEYIGEFFSEPVKVAEVMLFKSASAEPAVVVVEVEAAPASEVIELVQRKELEDDLVITVAADHVAVSSEDSKMSDKVVHAMLDEARLVCVS